MMYVHFCKPCNRIHILNGHKQNCPRCGSSLTELKLSYLDYTSLTIEERAKFLEKLKNPEHLEEYATIYRMYKYSKWYKKMMEDKISEEAETIRKTETS